MKSKRLFLAMFLVFILGVGIAVAEDANVGNYTFTVPDEYTVINSTDNLIIMQKDEFNVINFATEVSDDIESAKQGLISSGNELISEDTQNYNNMDINVQVFKTSTGLYSYNYIFLGDNGNFAVTLVTDNADFDADLNSADNPVKVIFDSVVEN